jgi:hypothetical protein
MATTDASRDAVPSSRRFAASATQAQQLHWTFMWNGRWVLRDTVNQLWALDDDDRTMRRVGVLMPDGSAAVSCKRNAATAAPVRPSSDQGFTGQPLQPPAEAAKALMAWRAPDVDWRNVPRDLADGMRRTIDVILTEPTACQHD